MRAIQYVGILEKNAPDFSIHSIGKHRISWLPMVETPLEGYLTTLNLEPIQLNKQCKNVGLKDELD